MKSCWSEACCSNLDLSRISAIAWRQTTIKKIRVTIFVHVNVWFIMTPSQKLGKQGNL